MQLKRETIKAAFWGVNLRVSNAHRLLLAADEILDLCEDGRTHLKQTCEVPEFSPSIIYQNSLKFFSSTSQTIRLIYYNFYTAVQINCLIIVEKRPSQVHGFYGLLAIICTCNSWCMYATQVTIVGLQFMYQWWGDAVAAVSKLNPTAFRVQKTTV